ncbi:hypothetical protein L9F63_010522 [Diploptera punctata]|uniref:Uncharacterized protein n=1 Tax=Diploptera punctata TaxID=6984 RepID=A0AAD8AH88_DIPPU|nr:hypothetical protein L9F63_010522 [Diploptera punctata]
MMSGDSPTPHSELVFDFKETSVSPPINAKCMQDKAVQCADHADETTNSGLAHQTIAVQELKHNFEEQEDPPLSQPSSYRRSLENEEAIEHIEEVATTSHVDTQPLKSEEETRINIDEPDGMCFQEPEPKPEESCGLQCLYYTLQCCDCTIL